MAKGQKRSNRETRKPKADKPSAAPASSSSAVTKALAPTGGPPKKRG